MKNEDKLILDLCGGSGAWSEPYMDEGYGVRLIDLENGEDVRLLKKLDEKVYGILCAPPCTHLALAGAVHWKSKGDSMLLEGLSVVDACIRVVFAHKPVFWCLENPTGRLIHYLGEPRMRFSPSDYGDNYTKRTLLWGDFNPPGKWFPTKPVKNRGGHHSMDLALDIKGKYGDRSRLRSVTPPKFAKAFMEANR